MFSPPDYSKLTNFLYPKLGPWSFILFLHRKKILESLMKSLQYIRGKVLDIGCGNKPYRSIINYTEYIGVDVDSSPHLHQNFDKVYDGLYLPFEDNSFDSIICTEVIEHCINPDLLFLEMKRVLKQGGFAFVTAPMCIEHHEIPNDLRRLTYYGMLHLAESNGFKVNYIEDRGNIYSVLVSNIYSTISQIISKRPFSDILLWLIFPFTYILYKFDSFRKKNPPIMSLGWQMLIEKTL
jgi:SAM-dependent methyltransferase